MIDYCCPECGRKLLEAACSSIPVLVEIKCRACKAVVAPVPRGRRPQPHHRTYRCSSCHREQHVERPVNERSYCVVCGTSTLVIIAETPNTHQRPAVEAPAHSTR